MSKVVLYGVCYELESLGIGEGYRDHEVREALATFDDERLAKAYIKKSKLKSYSEWNRTSTRYPRKQFRATSLLHYYTDAEIETYVAPTIPPHNPTI
jgi:hypothetical protein